jgi:hypothetical protein
MNPSLDDWGIQQTFLSVPWSQDANTAVAAGAKPVKQFKNVSFAKLTTETHLLQCSFG